MLHEIHHNRSTTPIPLVARMTKAESKRLQWERGRSEEAKFDGWMTADEQGHMFNDYNTGNIFSESVAPFDDTQVVSARTMILQPAQWRHLVRQKLKRCGRLVRLYVHEMAVLSL